MFTFLRFKFNFVMLKIIFFILKKYTQYRLLILFCIELAVRFFYSCKTNKINKGKPKIKKPILDSLYA